MHSLSPESRINSSLLLFGLLIKCPFEREIVGCPLLALRRVKCLEDKYVLAEQFSEGESRRLLTMHQACYLTRLVEVYSVRDGLARQTSLPPRLGSAKPEGLQQVSANC